MLEDEIWHEVIDFPKYHVSNHGRIKHVARSEARKIEVNAGGFPIIVLFGKDGSESKTRYVRHLNQIVADAFLPPPTFENETSVWHIDGDLSNCRADNLKWESRARVLEWNDMNRTRLPKHITPKVMNIRTGVIYEDAFDCAMQEGRLETDIVIRCEKGSPRYKYV